MAITVNTPFIGLIKRRTTSKLIPESSIPLNKNIDLHSHNQQSVRPREQQQQPADSSGGKINLYTTTRGNQLITCSYTPISARHQLMILSFLFLLLHQWRAGGVMSIRFIDKSSRCHSSILHLHLPLPLVQQRTTSGF